MRTRILTTIGAATAIAAQLARLTAALLDDLADRADQAAGQETA